nr:T9SS type A sorting domain-containing protein [Bacteroidota bacterium]
NKTLTRATPPSGVTYYWQGTSCGTSTSNSAATYVATTSGTYYLRAQNNNSNSWSSCSSVNVTVNQAPSNAPAPTVSSSTCGLTVLTHATPPSGVTYYWQGTSCGTNTGNSSATYAVTAGGTYYLAARSTAGCWSSACSSLPVNVIASPSTPPVPSSSSNSCGPKTLTRATPPAGTTYYWQGISCGTSTLNSSATYTVGTSGTYYLKAKNTSGCWSNCSSLAVNITPCPTNLSASIGGVCPNKTVSLNWANSGGTWTVDVSLDPAFNSTHTKTVSNVTSVTAPSGFNPALVLQPNANYYWRMKAGSTILNGPPFSVPFCDIITPATNISALNGWQNTTFTVNFTDTDNNTVGKSFYNVSDFNGTEWRANGLRGFFNDNFDNSSLSTDWSSTNGLWAVTSGNLEQTDETSANTNVSAAVTQSLSNRYLYHWNAKIDGIGTNRKAGLHFLASSSSLSNRGNSYLVQMNIDAGTVEFYQSVNNVISLVKQADYNFIAGQYYDFKIIYDRTTGKMDVYVNDILVESWQDATPLTLGNFASFRTENASLSVNYFEVLRSRNASVAIAVGTAQTNDIRFQNAGPNLAAGKILSLVTDVQGNISTSASTPVNIDWTPPLAVANVKDGTGADINTTLLMNQLSGNWAPSVDPNSGTTNYYYSIGINPGDTSVTGWTNNNLQVMAMKNNLSLTLNQVYYFNVKAKNGAGLYSPVLSSNGQTVVASVIGMEELSSVSSLMIYPNPFNESAILDYSLVNSQHVTVTLTDVLGRTITSWSKNEDAGNHHLQINSTELQLATGMYFLKFQTGGSAVVVKLILNK